MNRRLLTGKVPALTVGFWIVYVAATTLGETGGDAVSTTLDWGYFGGAALFFVAFIVLVVAQIRARRLQVGLFWATMVACTMFGTTLADFTDRSLGVGYAGGSTLLFACVLATLAVWYVAEGTVAVGSVNAPKAEIFFWIAVTFAQTLGTALGDWVSDGWGLGSASGALVFAAGLFVVAALAAWTKTSRVALFWAAFILARPLGATAGDFLDQPAGHGGLGLSRFLASALIAAFIVVCLLVMSRRAPSGEAVARDTADAEDLS